MAERSPRPPVGKIQESSLLKDKKKALRSETESLFLSGEAYVHLVEAAQKKDRYEISVPIQSARTYSVVVETYAAGAPFFLDFVVSTMSALRVSQYVPDHTDESSRRDPQQLARLSATIGALLIHLQKDHLAESRSAMDIAKNMSKPYGPGLEHVPELHVDRELKIRILLAVQNDIDRLFGGQYADSDIIEEYLRFIETAAQRAVSKIRQECE